MEEEVEVSSSSNGGGMLTISGLEASVTYDVRIGAVNSVLGASTHTSSFVVLTHGMYSYPSPVTCVNVHFL